MREARSGLRLELVAREVLGAERERLVDVGIECGGALAGDPVDEVERDVVESGIAKMVESASDVVRTGNTLEHLEQLRVEGLRAERDPRHAPIAKQRGKLGRHRLGIRLHRDLRGDGQRLQQAAKLGGLREGRGAASEEHGLELGCEQRPLQLELGQQRVDVRSVLPDTADDRDEVAVPAPVRAERQVDVEVARSAGHFPFSFRLRTARNASWGTSTAPTCFIRFLPFFWRSSSLRFRVMSPP